MRTYMETIRIANLFEIQRIIKNNKIYKTDKTDKTDKLKNRTPNYLLIPNSSA